MYSIILVFLSMSLLSFISFIFIKKINNKISEIFILILSIILFTFISFKIFPLLFFYNNLYLTSVFILVGIVFSEILNILLKNKKYLYNEKEFLCKDFLYFFAQGSFVKLSLDMQYYTGVVFLVIVFIYNFFRNFNNFKNDKNNIFINSLFIIFGSIIINIFFNISFIFISFLGGIILYELSDEIITYFSNVISYILKKE